MSKIGTRLLQAAKEARQMAAKPMPNWYGQATEQELKDAEQVVRTTHPEDLQFVRDMAAAIFGR